MNDQENGIGAAGQGLSFGGLVGWAVAMGRSPRRFFASLAKTGGFATPILYALFWLFVSTLVEFGVSKFRLQPIKFGVAVEILWVVLGPGILLVLGFIVSAVFFVIWHLMGSKENYETAFRCWAFTTPVAVLGSLLGVVPFLNVLAFGYGIFLLAVASIELHKISPVKSWTVWGALCAVLMVVTGLSILARKALQTQGMNLAQPGSLPGLPQFGGGPNAGVPNAQNIQEIAQQVQKQMEEEMKKQGAQAPAEEKK